MTRAVQIGSDFYLSLREVNREKKGGKEKCTKKRRNNTGEVFRSVLSCTFGSGTLCQALLGGPLIGEGRERERGGFARNVSSRRGKVPRFIFLAMTHPVEFRSSALRSCVARVCEGNATSASNSTPLHELITNSTCV